MVVRVAVIVAASPEKRRCPDKSPQLAAKPSQYSTAAQLYSLSFARTAALKAAVLKAGVLLVFATLL